MLCCGVLFCFVLIEARILSFLCSGVVSVEKKEERDEDGEEEKEGKEGHFT